ncbi:FkbM family methyltransferase [Mucilaginibacter xinganensis]|uniref:Methyltransferase, FkbM family n=1 Tax=Mucilaginibacter xinganensis TaxID=1234841 RepID=A0A223P2L6_9SPHI|nr:FkbM family methyltransferase [Mucilaginibacter xinganensis]ASU36290.1 methyltransferase, FkbM family [Mucilaginibacter xinganensis]
MKSALKKLFNFFGYELRRIDPFPPGAPQRPVGSMNLLLEDLKARGLNCRSIMDVGAHTGSWSIMAKQIFPEAKFCLIEPQIEMEDNLKLFCSTSNNSTYFIAGAGPVTEKKHLTLWDDFAGSSFLPVEDEAHKAVGRQRMVSMIAIDEIIATNEFEVPELVKLDVQGYELEALKGAGRLFGKTEVFILEASLFSFSDVTGMPIFSEVMNFMLERDYLVYDFAGFSRRPLDGALGQCDICFVKRDGFLRSSNEWN